MYRSLTNIEYMRIQLQKLKKTTIIIQINPDKLTSELILALFKHRKLFYQKADYVKP